MNRFLDIPSAVRLLSLSPRTLKKRRWLGGGPAYHKVRRRGLYSVEDLERWVESVWRRSTHGDVEETSAASDFSPNDQRQLLLPLSDS